MEFNPEEESPVVFIDRIINTDTGEEEPTDKYGEKVLDIIGRCPPEDIEELGIPNHCIAHCRDLGLDVFYSVGYQPKG